MIIDCVSDLHGFYPQLEGGDLLIVAGDLTARDTFDEYLHVLQHISKANYKKRILVGGNHDNLLQQHPDFFDLSINYDFLWDSGIEFEYEEDFYCNFCGVKDYKLCEKTPICQVPEKKKLKIWGSPWTTKFPGMNPHCMAFTVDSDEELASKWALIPNDIDILVTHSPMFGMLDRTIDGRLVGSPSLGAWISKSSSSLKLHVCGHIHEAYGFYDNKEYSACSYVNASHVNERYRPVNKPIRVIL